MVAAMRGLAAALALAAATPAGAQALLPAPARVQPAGDGFALAAATPLVAEDAGERAAAARYAELMATAGVRLGPARPTRSPVR